MRLGWWIKGWGDPFPYGPNEIMRNPLCLDWKLTTPPTPNPLIGRDAPIWSPPSHSTLKWNVDASLKIHESKSAIGGVLRDHHGKFLCLFSSPIPYMEINHGEILAIHRAIKISLTLDWCTHSHLIVESDSKNAVKWCNGENGGPWNLTFIINFIRHAMTTRGGIEVVYKGRETNMVADSMAKQGLTRRDEFIAWL